MPRAPKTKKPPRASPLAYLLRARSFADAARLLSEQQKADFMPYIACCGYAVEVALKGYLVGAGLDEHTLSNDPGHKLERAWSLAREKGLPLRPFPRWCKLLDRLHASPYHARYPTSGLLVGLPPTRDMLDGIDQAIEIIRNGIAKESRRRLTSG